MDRAMAKTAISTDLAPPPVAAYSQAVRSGNVVQVAGQGPGHPATGQLVAGGIAEQTRRTLDNVAAILEAAGLSFDDVVMTRIYLADLADFAAMNEVYTTYVSQPYPARTTVGVSLPPGMLIEIDALAVVDAP
jgi:2-iminobutanoate/2-iminopropanoate deaminase